MEAWYHLEEKNAENDNSKCHENALRSFSFPHDGTIRIGLGPASFDCNKEKMTLVEY